MPLQTVHQQACWPLDSSTQDTISPLVLWHLALSCTPGWLPHPGLQIWTVSSLWTPLRRLLSQYPCWVPLPPVQAACYGSLAGPVRSAQVLAEQADLHAERPQVSLPQLCL